MTEKQKPIDDNNELIAIFDGWEPFDFGGDATFKKNGSWLYLRGLKYNSDRNWLHSAWEKFRDLKFDEYSKRDFEHAELKLNIAHWICYGNIDTAYQAIVSGIQWYNLLNKQS